MDKERIVLSDDNRADYYSWEYPESLVKGLQISEGGIDGDSGVVLRMLEWLAVKSRGSRTTHYEMSRHDAAVTLELVAGWPAARED